MDIILKGKNRLIPDSLIIANTELSVTNLFLPLRIIILLILQTP